MNPLLKWVGSKRWHVPAVKELMLRNASSSRVVELFCGGCAITFGLEPTRALLNDVNPHLVNFYAQVQQGFMREGSLEFTSSEGLYYDYRAWFNRLVREGRSRTEEAAQLFFYLNHHGFNGLCRFNKSGEFNVPFREGRSCPAIDWADAQAKLAGWSFTCDDFTDVLLEPDDFVYADPPYDSTFNDYTEGGWSRERAEELAILLRSHSGPVILMNSATPWIIELYTSLGYWLTMLESSQKMRLSRGRTDVVPEVMATNFIVD